MSAALFYVLFGYIQAGPPHPMSSIPAYSAFPTVTGLGTIGAFPAMTALPKL